jgi:hypothetical protein
LSPEDACGQGLAYEQSRRVSFKAVHAAYLTTPLGPVVYSSRVQAMHQKYQTLPGAETEDLPNF